VIPPRCGNLAGHLPHNGFATTNPVPWCLGVVQCAQCSSPNWVHYGKRYYPGPEHYAWWCTSCRAEVEVVPLGPELVDQEQ
jgi:hypothetical protein